MSSSVSDDFPHDPFIEELRCEEPPRKAPAALANLLALWRSLAAGGTLSDRS